MGEIAILNGEHKESINKPNLTAPINGHAFKARNDQLEFYLNGKREIVRDCDPSMTLLEYLRVKKGLTGTKLGCGEGGCGACTVVVSGKSVNSCLTPVCAVDGQSVVTIEGIGNTKRPHVVQKTIADAHGSQCGYCTPGFVMSLYCNVKNGKIKDIESCYDGNLCRCTGYRPLVDAAKSFVGYDIEAQKKEFADPGEQLCPREKANKTLFGRSGKYPNGATWYQPISLSELLQIKEANPDSKIIGGNTEVGIEVRYKHFRNSSMVYICNIEELKSITLDEITGDLKIGGAATLSELLSFLESKVENGKEKEMGFQLRGYKAMIAMLKWFASTQIRNMATLAGNIVTASPISDMNPVLMALGAKLILRSAKTKRTRIVSIDNFFLSYRKVDLDKYEVLEEIVVPGIKNKYEYVACFKQARRREDDISIVNACFKLFVKPKKDSIEILDIRMCYGGVAPTTIRAKQTEEFLKHKIWSKDAILEAVSSLSKEISLPDDVPGGMAKYRSTLVISYLYKFFITTSEDLNRDGLYTMIDQCETSASRNFLIEPPPVPKSSQFYPQDEGGLQSTNFSGERDHQPSTGLKREPVGAPIRHRSALAQCTGEAKYVDDIAEISGSAHAAFLLSTRPHARIVNIDSSKAEKTEGFLAFFSASDLSDLNNKLGPVSMDEQLFRSETVTSTGQPIGIVVAESHEMAQEAVSLIIVEYEDLPAIITIEEARSAKSFHSVVHEINTGDVEKAFLEADAIVEGEVAMAGQEHFYLETNSSYAVPGEDGEITVHASTQNPEKTQKFVAHACGVDKNRVNCRVKRMGGGFGGKETRSVFVSVAVGFAAYRLGLPVKMTLERDIDMWITGTRHPFIGAYKAAATNDGRLLAVSIDLFSNCGYSLDLSESVMDRALFHVDNSYKIPNVKARGFLCMTNTTTNTAFRGFGGPQGMLVIETIINHLSSQLNIVPEVIRARNLYEAGDFTHYGQQITECALKRMWSELLKESDYHKRENDVQEFNKNNRWRKKGIAMLPVKFGINFTAKFLNQAGALVHVYTDGTVLITHGGTEMGQGLHTKIVQVAAREFGISVDKVHISETATDKVPNSSPTAASASSDIYGMAVLNACEQINQRLEPFRKENKGKSFQEIVSMAYFARVDLSAHGFYKTPFVGYDWSGKDPNMKEPFNYFTYGVACTESMFDRMHYPLYLSLLLVEVDVLTGDSRPLRTDIIMDLGKSLNPAIDIGQIEGGFTQGFGWCMMEEPIWGYSALPWIPEGSCFTRGPGAYKIPSADDVPVEFNVKLLDNSPNRKAIHSSRAVGEPPFFLGASAYFATYKAITAARAAAKVSSLETHNYVRIDSPLSSERIRMACADEFTQKVCPIDYRPNGFV